MFDKAIGYEFGQGHANKQIRNANKALSKANDKYDEMVRYYTTALNEMESENKQLKFRINEFLGAQTRNKKKFDDLKSSYIKYKEDSKKLMVNEYTKAVDALEVEKKKNILLEEKIRILEMKIEHMEE